MNTMEQILTGYYEDNGRKLRGAVNQILSGFGGIWDKDMDDFYSLANEVFVDVMRRYEGTGSFDRFLYSCLSARVKTEITRRNRKKRRADRLSVSLDTPVGEGELTVGDMIPSDFDIEQAVFGDRDPCYSGRLEEYFHSLSRIQRQIMELRMDGVPVPEIKRKLKLSKRQYDQNFCQATSFEKINLICGGHGAKKPDSIKAEERDKGMGNYMTQTKEKSKQDRMSAASVAKKIDRHILRFDHPLQRESEQWSPSMKGNLISDILQGNPLPSLVFAEQVVNSIAIIWNLDGKQRCTNVYSYLKDGFRVSKNVRRWEIEYQAPATDGDGNEIFDEDHFPVYEQKLFDIRGKRFSELPEELKDRLRDYSFEIVQYLNCSGEDIAYHIARYNEGKPMTVCQKGITRLGEEYAGLVKAISNMPFFKDVGGYKVSEFKNGAINRVVIEGIMAAYYLDDWKKRQEDMCDFIRNHAGPADFDDFEDMVGRLERVMTDEVSEIFDSKDSFLWFGLFARFRKLGLEDQRFMEFMTEFIWSLHMRKIKGVSFDDLSRKSTKDKSIVRDKMDHLMKLMEEFLFTP
ncbi:MAG: hypothetical protein HFG77_13530 [Hungatella sp.]|jgi:hypothetical protein|nr:hypothetical protein [Hungatella sp.]